jgi:hypothetical protein
MPKSISDEVDEEVGEFPSRNGEDRLGARIGNAIAGGIATLAINIILLFARITPGGWKMGRGLIRAGYKTFYKSSGKIDNIAHVCIGNHIKHVPVKYNYDLGRYETFADEPEYWYAPSEAENEYRVGPVPSLWMSARSTELGSHVQADVAEVLDLGGGRDLYTDAQVQHVEVTPGAGTDASGQAMADGGATQQSWGERVSIHDPGTLADQLVDLDTGLEDSDAGRVVSMDKYYETYPEKAATEEMELQEWRGIQKALDDEELRALMIKLMLIAGAIVVGSLVAAFVLPAVLGGGGGGGVIPLALGLGGGL